jgi:CheY-like chemotaxis protein
MVVDDEPAVRRLLALILKNAGYEVLPAEDGESALSLLDEVIPDLMVVDVRLPGMDGIELTRRVKDDGRLHGIPVLLVSAFERPAGVEEAGAEAFLSKPFDMDALLDLVRKYLRRD